MDKSKVVGEGSPTEKYSCGECLESFKTTLNLQLHQLRAHGKGRLFCCDDCEFKTPRKKDLQSITFVHEQLANGDLATKRSRVALSRSHDFEARQDPIRSSRVFLQPLRLQVLGQKPLHGTHDKTFG